MTPGVLKAMKMGGGGGGGGGGRKFSSAHIKYTIGHPRVMHVYSDINKSAPVLTNATIALGLGQRLVQFLSLQVQYFKKIQNCKKGVSLFY